MMKNIYAVFLGVIIILSSCNTKPKQYDLCIYGATSSGVIAAYTAAQLGMDVVLIEPTNRIGGLTTGGLGYTDIGNKQAIKGVALDFFRKVGKHYGCLEQWIFEPSVAEKIMNSYLDNNRITLLKNHRLISSDNRKNKIELIRIEDNEGTISEICSKYYVDCSYEGDLMAKSNVSYTYGREANSVYNETINGVELMDRHQFPDGIDPYVIKGDPQSGLLWGISDEEVASNGAGDNKIQAYNYRICLTDSVENMIPITRPENYDSLRYELLLRLMEKQPEKQSLNDYFIWSIMPNRKTDINNRGGFSTDMIGMNHDYCEGSYQDREKITKNHIDYTKGLLYFFGHDTRVSDSLRHQMLKWGYPKDEYVDNNHWTPQLYVRECRRLKGEYTVTQANCERREVVDDGIALAAYKMDSHNCQRIVIEKDGKKMVKNEGNVEIGGGLPYPIPYRCIAPKREECVNLLVPVACSASHIAYGSIRMEPVFMELGQASAIAAYYALRDNISVQEVSSEKINKLFNENPYMDNSQPDIIVDDNDSNVEYTNGWKQMAESGGFGLTYLKLMSTQSYQEVKYSIKIPKSDVYSIYSYVSKTTTCSKIPYVIHYNNIDESVIIDKSQIKIIGHTSGAWVKVGDFDIKEPAMITISLSNKNIDGVLCADAILVLNKEKN